MNKTLLAIALCVLPELVLAAQTPITQIDKFNSPATKINDMREATNTRLAAAQSNFTELYTLLGGNPWLAQTTTPSITNVFWVDTSGASPVIKYYDGDSWEVAAAGDGGTYTLPNASTTTKGGIIVGDRLTIDVNGVLSADVQTTDISGKENSLGNPSTNGYVLSSTTTGARSWIEMAGGGVASISDTAYSATTWDAVVDVAPSKNTVRDMFESLPSLAFDSATLTTTTVEDTDTISVKANTFQAYDANMITWPSAINGDEVGYLDGLTEALSASLSAKAPLASPVFTTSMTIPQGASPTVDVAGKFALDTTSDQLIYFGGSKRVLTYKKQIDFAVKTPVDADDFLLFRAQTAITITDIHVIAQGGTSISVDVQECDSAGANCATVDAAITAGTDGAKDDGTLSNGAIDAGDWVKVVLGAPSGTVNYLAGSIYYVETAD